MLHFSARLDKTFVCDPTPRAGFEISQRPMGKYSLPGEGGEEGGACVSLYRLCASPRQKGEGGKDTIDLTRQRRATKTKTTHL